MFVVCWLFLCWILLCCARLYKKHILLKTKDKVCFDNYLMIFHCLIQWMLLEWKLCVWMRAQSTIIILMIIIFLLQFFSFMLFWKLYFNKLIASNMSVCVKECRKFLLTQLTFQNLIKWTSEFWEKFLSKDEKFAACP